jgi:hypothetical protein
MKLKNIFPKGKNARYTGIGIAVFALIIAGFVGPRLLKKKEQNQAANLPIVAPGTGSVQTGMLNNLPAVEQALNTLRPANVYRGRSRARSAVISPFSQRILM